MTRDRKVVFAPPRNPSNVPSSIRTLLDDAPHQHAEVLTLDRPVVVRSPTDSSVCPGEMPHRDAVGSTSARRVAELFLASDQVKAYERRVVRALRMCGRQLYTGFFN